MLSVLSLLLLWAAPAFAQSGLPAPVAGFADLHNHMFAEHALDGAWLHGSVEGEISKALAPCDSNPDPSPVSVRHARLRIPWVSALLGRIHGLPGDTGAHFPRTEGFPSFRDWPRWNTLAHQQVWSGHLKTAHEAGLSLLVVSLTNFEPLCEWMADENRKFRDCSDTSTLHRQLDAVDRFAKDHPWFRVVRTPWEAREAIRSGKLAVVLSIEASNLFGKEDWRPEFDRAHARGVRTLQLTHELDNRFAGAAIHHPAYRMIAWWQDFQARARFWEILTPKKFGFQMARDPETGTKKNRSGLTAEGRDLIALMIRKGMPIDLAHLSEQSIRDLQPLTLNPTDTSRQSAAYPVYMSHGRLREAMDDGKSGLWESSSPSWVLEYIRDSGGVFGLRTDVEKVKSFPDSPAPNDCHGSTKSFAQAVQWGERKGLKIAFGTDMNGFSRKLRPRFGDPHEACGAERDPKERRLQQILQTQPLHERFDQSGLGDISQLPDVMRELKNFEVKTQTLHRSAEEFIQMWERADWISRSLAP